MQKLRTNDFELNFLEGWRDASQVVLIGPERPVFTPNIQVHRESLPNEDLAGFFRGQREELSSLDGFLLLEHGDRVLAGSKALFHAFSWEMPERPGIRLRQLQLAVDRLGTLFTITCSALEQDWDLAEPGFEMTIAGFAWI